MPEGPLGFPRFTSIGPFTSQTDEEFAREYITSEGANVYPEASIRRTILDLNNVTGCGLADIHIQGISMISKDGREAEYHPGYEVISISFEVVYVYSDNGGDYEKFLKFLTAHEYAHHILNSDNMEQAIRELHDNALFDYRDISRLSEHYDFKQDEYRTYDNIDEFIDHVSEYSPIDGVRPVEGFCNSLGLRYSGLGTMREIELKNTIRENIQEIHEYTMTGRGPEGLDIPELWKIEW